MEYLLKRDLLAGGIPYLQLDAVGGTPREQGQCVLLLHGMGGSKEHTISRMMQYVDAGFDAVLVGEAFVTSRDPAMTVSDFATVGLNAS